MAQLTIDIRVSWWFRPAVIALLLKARVLRALGLLTDAKLAVLMAEGERLAKRAINVRDWRRVRPWYVIGFASLFSGIARRGQ